MKLKVVSVSLIIKNSTAFSSPMVSSSISSFSISSRTSRMSNGAKRAPQLIRMEERVLPADSKNFLYCRTAKWSGSFCSSRSNMRSTGLWKSGSSSRASLAFIISSRVVKFISSAGASYQM